MDTVLLPMDILITGVAVIVVNVITNVGTIKWLRSDLKKHEKKHDEHVEMVSRVQIQTTNNFRELYERSHNLMRRDDVERIVKAEVAPLKTDIDRMFTLLKELSDSVAGMDKSMAVLTDRYEQCKVKCGPK